MIGINECNSQKWGTYKIINKGDRYYERFKNDVWR